MRPQPSLRAGRSEYWCLFVKLRDIDDLTEDWAAVKLILRRTWLPRSVWITENQGYQHDVRVKISRLRSGAAGSGSMPYRSPLGRSARRSYH
jgi:hypothetical protein